ncbi:MAG: ribose-phosphate diphosphokinase [Bacillota bacterium]|jgi:ribose-phosphate pyrophosphokinase
MNNNKLKLFSANANMPLSKEIASYLGISLGKSQMTTFADGELFLEIGESVRGADIFIVQPTCYPANDHMMELLVMIDAMRRASAQRITAVMPYYGYARQERKTKARDPITAKLVANLLAAAGADRVMSIDFHAGAIEGFFDIPVDHLPGVPLLAEYYKTLPTENLVVVSPDVGGANRARKMANCLALDVDIAIIDKRRPAANQTKIMHVVGDIAGKDVVMVDDIVDTAGTLTQGAAVLKEMGAKNIYACCTHAVFTPPALERIEESAISQMVTTNTIPINFERQGKCSKIKVLSVAPLIGEAIIRIHENLSISRLFD